MVTIREMTPEQLKQWREKHGYSQKKLADALGVFRETVVRWETGVRGIPSFLGLALEALEARGGEKKSRATKTKTGKGEKDHGSDLPER